MRIFPYSIPILFAHKLQNIKATGVWNLNFPVRSNLITISAKSCKPSTFYREEVCLAAERSTAKKDLQHERKYTHRNHCVCVCVFWTGKWNISSMRDLQKSIITAKHKMHSRKQANHSVAHMQATFRSDLLCICEVNSYFPWQQVEVPPPRRLLVKKRVLLVKRHLPESPLTFMRLFEKIVNYRSQMHMPVKGERAPSM